MSKQEKWFPEFVYEENGQKIPSVIVPVDEEMHEVVFLMIIEQTEEFEPGPNGEAIPIADMEIKSYYDSSVVKAALTEAEYDKVRYALGLRPLADASKAGTRISENVRENVKAMNTAKEELN